MHADKDVDLSPSIPGNTDELTRDLGLDGLLDTMAGGNAVIRSVSRVTLLDPLQQPLAILYRQQILADALAAPGVVHDLYDLAAETLESAKTAWYGIFSTTPSSILRSSVRSLDLLTTRLHSLRHIVETHDEAFTSPGMRRFASTVKDELTEDYFQVIHDHLAALTFPKGPLISAQLGPANQGSNFVLRKPCPSDHNPFRRMLSADSRSFQLDPRDDRGMEALAQIEARGINLVANAVAQSADHILAFFTELRTELAFYLGCINLRQALAAAPVPCCFPLVTVPAPGLWFTATGIRDTSLALSAKHVGIVGNDVTATGASFIVVTGANEGGKSTFLRSLGTAQLMMHAGMFVCATTYSSAICADLQTHFKREEDASLSRGKLEEELERMRSIAGRISAGSVVLFNESFSSTNEREGSMIALDIARAFSEAGIRMVFVTHSDEFASALQQWQSPRGLFLRAERTQDGRRTFKLEKAAPMGTSFSADLYNEVFGADGASSGSANTLA